MWAVLIGVICCYAAAVLCIHFVRRSGRVRNRVSRRYILIAADHEGQMEWILRVLRREAALTGTEVQVMIVDAGSRDDTMRIASFFARGADGAVSLWQEAGEAAGSESCQNIADNNYDRSANFYDQFGLRFHGVNKKANSAAEHDGVPHWFWLHQPDRRFGGNGVESPVLIDLRNPGDWEKLPI